MSAEDASKVSLYLYDLSQGLAKNLSQALTGTQIDGIWHTSVVVFQREYYFGQGILSAMPGTTAHGSPVRVFDMGSTNIPKDVFLEYIQRLREVYT